MRGFSLLAVCAAGTARKDADGSSEMGCCSSSVPSVPSGRESTYFYHCRENGMLSRGRVWVCARVRIRSGFSYSTNYTAIWANVLRCSRATVIPWLFYIQLRRRRRRFHREKPISSVANHENYTGFVYTGCRYCMTNCVFVPPRCAFFCLTYSTFALRSCYARACGVICKINHMPMLS